MPSVQPFSCEGVCSDGSSYAPVAQLFVSHRLAGDTLFVVVDSGRVGTPTLRPSGSRGPTVMNDLTFRAFVARSSTSTGTVRQSGEGHASVVEHEWDLVSQAQPQALSTQLSFGEVLPVPHTSFRLALASGIDASDVWLGFEIAGNAVDPRVESEVRGTTRGGVRVYVCDPRTLGGRVDTLRARRLRETYGAVC